jgi:hypothetical protein
MSVDPSDDSTFWFTNEYMGSGWKTRIASFNFGPIMPPVVYAGNDTLICSADPFTTDASASYQQSVLWESSGDGFFLDPTKLDAIYLRGSGDIDSGQVQLTINAMGYLPDVIAKDSLILSFTRMASSYAGVDTSMCAGESIMLNGTASNYDSLEWTTEGDGTFDMDTVLHPYYTPGPEDVINGYTYLHLLAYDIFPCVQHSNDKMRLNIEDCTGIPETSKGQLEMKVVPNPASSQVKFDLTGFTEKDEILVALINSEGQTVFTMRLKNINGSYSNNIDLSYFPHGIYYLKASNASYNVSRKLVIQ